MEEPTRHEMARSLLNAERIIKLLLVRLGGSASLSMDDLLIEPDKLDLYVEMDAGEMNVCYTVKRKTDGKVPNQISKY